MSQLPVPYAPRYTLVARVRRAWPLVVREAGEWPALFGLAAAAIGTAAVIAVIAVNTWK